jgi:hypothetical protein
MNEEQVPEIARFSIVRENRKGSERRTSLKDYIVRICSSVRS